LSRTFWNFFKGTQAEPVLCEAHPHEGKEAPRLCKPDIESVIQPRIGGHNVYQIDRRKNDCDTQRPDSNDAAARSLLALVPSEAFFRLK
jgi:hypothetical protein